MCQGEREDMSMMKVIGKKEVHLATRMFPSAIMKGNKCRIPARGGRLTSEEKKEVNAGGERLSRRTHVEIISGPERPAFYKNRYRNIRRRAKEKAGGCRRVSSRKTENCAITSSLKGKTLENPRTYLLNHSRSSLWQRLEVEYGVKNLLPKIQRKRLQKGRRRRGVHQWDDPSVDCPIDLTEEKRQPVADRNLTRGRVK